MINCDRYHQTGRTYVHIFAAHTSTILDGFHWKRRWRPKGVGNALP